MVTVGMELGKASMEPVCKTDPIITMVTCRGVENIGLMNGMV